ncbi:MAG TPA: heparinase II/III family protein [Phycisphaerae bacterium]|nr:heparinase II/III family protein [Phycisphaerae bacterium]
MPRSARALAAVLLGAAGLSAAQPDAPSHGRPFLMPRRERDRIRKLIAAEEWARAEHERARSAAAKGDGYQAALLYALDGDANRVPTATSWLMKRLGPQASWVRQYAASLADPNHFKAGMPHLANVYYDIDVSGLVAFDWVHRGLADADRKAIREGILTLARYRMRAMDRWTQTANLVFKPTFYVAVAGLVTGDRECLDWGFHRKRRPGGGQPGYFVVLDEMLRDGGPWHEAPIYPIAHRVLYCMAVLSRLRGLYDGGDWFAREAPSGGSPKGLADYYIDTAYPMEQTEGGARRVRVASTGDGATGPGGDLFLIQPDGPGIKCHEALSAVHAACGDERYAPFVGMIPAYRPDLVDRRPVARDAAFPPAPSKVWPGYGLAMLRSDEAPSYWTGGKAIAAFAVMSQGYGHDHRDKFSICLHGAGRLIYPDYNAIQYENQAIGWTRNSVCHNTLVVDEQDTQDAAPTGIRHEFSPEVKYLATSASGVFEGVEQTRVLLLTGEYLLDVFDARSDVPHTYDYLLHSFGQVRAVGKAEFAPSRAMRRRYWLVEDTRSLQTDDPWSMDLLLGDAPGGHEATCRVTMAAGTGTLVTHGVWGKQLAELVAGRGRGKGEPPRLDRLTMLAARRARRGTTFAAAHEPFPAGAEAEVTGVTVAARSADALVVRVDGRSFTDYAAVSFGPQKDKPLHLLAARDGTFAFRDYGYLRIDRRGVVAARGGWVGFAVAGAGGEASVNGRPAELRARDGRGVYGDVGGTPSPAPEKPLDPPFEATVRPEVVRLSASDRREVTLAFRNQTGERLSGQVEFDLPEGLRAEPACPAFGPVGPGATVQVRAAFVAVNAPVGRRTVPYRIVYQASDGGRPLRAAALAMALAVGPTLKFVYQHPKPAVYRVAAPKYTAEFDMFHGLCRRLADDDGQERLEGRPLLTISDGERPLLFEGTERAFTWPRKAPADLLAHAYDRCRWQALFLGDRVVFRMDRNYTQFERALFTVPGDWVSPAGRAEWRRVVAVGDAGKERDAQPRGTVRVAAAELGFPKAKWHLAFEFRPPAEVTFEGTKLTFRIGALTGDRWSVGFTRPDKLDAWRGR